MYRSHLPGEDEFSPPSCQAPPPSSRQSAPLGTQGAHPRQGPLSQILGSLFGGGDPPAFLRKGFPGMPDQGDILLILLLLYLYWESEDDEWLIILGLLFLFN